MGAIVMDLKNQFLVVTIVQTFDYNLNTIELRALKFFVVENIINSMHELQIIAKSRPGQLSYLQLK